MRLARGVLVVAAGLAVLIPGCACDVAPTLRGTLGGSSGCRDSEVVLVAAAARGDVDAVRDALDRGVSPDVEDRSGNRPLTCAGPAGHTEVVAALLDAGADVDARSRDGDSLVTDAVRFCRPGVLRLLLGAGADPNSASGGNSALSQAVDAGGAKAVEALVAAKVDVGSLARVHRTALADQESTSPCPEPTGEGRSSSLTTVLAAGADPTTVLGMAASWDLIDPLRAAIAAGAKLDEGEVAPGLESISCFAGGDGDDTSGVLTTVVGSPPVAILPSAACPPIVGLLQVALPNESFLSPDVFATTTTDPAGDVEEAPAAEPLASPPLLDVAWWGDVDAVAALLDAGAKVDHPGARGLTALHAAAAQGDAEVVDQLLAAGARGGAGSGSTTEVPLPSALARQQGYVDLAETLVAAGA